MLESKHKVNDDNVTSNVTKGQKVFSQFTPPPPNSREDLVDLIGEESVKNIEKIITS